MWCPGPVQPPDPLLEEGPDEDLSVTPPHPAVDVGTVAFEPESSLLFGAVSGAETLQEDDGSIRAPQITAEGSDGSALPGESAAQDLGVSVRTDAQIQDAPPLSAASSQDRSEEHTSELQSRGHLVCRLLLEKKKQIHSAGCRGLPVQSGAGRVRPSA